MNGIGHVSFCERWTLMIESKVTRKRIFLVKVYLADAADWSCDFVWYVPYMLLHMICVCVRSSHIRMIRDNKIRPMLHATLSDVLCGVTNTYLTCKCWAKFQQCTCETHVKCMALHLNWISYSNEKSIKLSLCVCMAWTRLNETSYQFLHTK